MSYVNIKSYMKIHMVLKRKKKKHNKKGIFPLGFYVLMRILVQLKTSHLSIPFLLWLCYISSLYTLLSLYFFAYEVIFPNFSLLSLLSESLCLPSFYVFCYNNKQEMQKKTKTEFIVLHIYLVEMKVIFTLFQV